MTLRRSTTIGFCAAILLGIAAFFFLRPRGYHSEPRVLQPSSSPVGAATPLRPDSKGEVTSATALVVGSTIADDLNAPAGTIRRDLEILNELLVAFQTNFPRLGNPVGENTEITAAFTGDNPAKFVFISPRHRAVNARGELCDRWGTPFRFHPVSGTQMEIRSAGPDRKFATPDDVEFAPWLK
jgi:hypothetical protein